MDNKFVNVTSFNDFKKLNEASIPSEFGNKTGFSESLVGRGLFSIIRYFKMGIDMGRLEYMRRKLENEYFAGWLRFCATKSINIQTGEMAEEVKEPESQGEYDVQSSAPQGQNEMEYPVICDLLHKDYTHNNPPDSLQYLKEQFGPYLEDLKESKDSLSGEELDDVEFMITEIEMYISYCDKKIAINTIFTKLEHYRSISQTSFSEDEINNILSDLDKIQQFLNGDAKKCKTYKLTDNEKNIINFLLTCESDAIKNKCGEINSLITNEGLKYHNYEMLNEELSGTGIPIARILGDKLNTAASTGGTSKTVTTKEYLKSINIDTVDQINFKACAELWKKHPEWRDEVAKLVSLEGVKYVQYAVSRIIYRVKKTPTSTGITPEKGGGVNREEDSSLRTLWEKKVEKVKGEWIYFINLEDYKLDPFKALTLQEAIRDKNEKWDGEVTKVQQVATAGGDTANVDKIGLVSQTAPYHREGTLVILQVMWGNNLCYILCSLSSSIDKRAHIYKYLGNLDVHKILTEKAYDRADFKNTASNYSTNIFSNDHHNKACSPQLNEIFKFNFSRKVVGSDSYQISGLYFGSSDFKRYSTLGLPTTQNSHIYHLYLKEGVLSLPFVNTTRTPKKEDIILEVMKQGGAKERVNDNDMLALKNTSVVNWKVGQIFTFKDSDWKKTYFPEPYLTKLETAKTTPESIVGPDYNGIFGF